MYWASARITEDMDRQLKNWQIRTRHGVRSEAVRILLENALNLEDLKAQGPDAAAKTIMDPADIAAWEEEKQDRLIAPGDLSPEQRNGIRALLDELDAREGGCT